MRPLGMLFAYLHKTHLNFLPLLIIMPWAHSDPGNDTDSIKHNGNTLT